MTNRLTELAEQCEQAGGPDRELDALIEIATNPRVPDSAQYVVSDNWIVTEEWQFPYTAPKFTASLDAAMTLVPDGWGYSICPTSVLLTRRGTQIMSRAATPALALTAAALRSRAAQGNE